MKRLLAVLLGALALAAPASQAAAPRPDARAWLVENGATGEVLVAHAAGAQVPIASITKLMTVLVTLDHARLDDVVTVSRRTSQVGESTINLRQGERITVHDMIEAALIQSANDAAWALAEYVGGSGGVPRFVAMMNAKARDLGLRHTHFANPSGLDQEGHYSSARDVTRLALVAMRKPIVRQTVRLRSATAAGRRLATWNDLLGRFPGLIGVKTGHTNDAGWSQVAAARGAGVTIYATLLGSPARERRNSDLGALLAWGLGQYRVVEAIDGRRVYATAKTGYGRGPVKLVASKPLRRAVRVGTPLVERVIAPSLVALPVRKGQQFGVVRVYSRGRLLGERPLVAAQAMEAPGFADRVGWFAGRTVANAWGLIT